MYKCGKEQAPVVFGKMVVWQEVTSEEVREIVFLMEDNITVLIPR